MNNTLKIINEILNSMDCESANVITLKSLVSSLVSENKVFFLEYEGKKLHYAQSTDEYCDSTSCYLVTRDYEPIWCTTDLIIAVYAKTINTAYYNSTVETPTWTSDIDFSKVQVVDNYGNVYNRKLLTYKTKAILYSKIRGENYYLKQIEKYPELANKPIDSIYEQQELLNEMKKDRLKFAGKITNKRIRIV